MASSRVKTLPGCGAAVCAGKGCGCAGASAAGLSAGINIVNIPGNENSASCINSLRKKIIASPQKYSH
jgi:hypothetical protein